MSSERNSDDSPYGLLGLRCCQLPYVKCIAYVPGFIFIAGYVLCIRQALLIGMPNHNNLAVFTKMLLGGFLFCQSYEVWTHLLPVIQKVVHAIVNEPSTLEKRTPEILLVGTQEVTKLWVCFAVSLIPLLVWAILMKQQQRFRFMWMDLRRRYRGELGSGRYYLSRPCRELEASPSTTSSVEGLTLRKTKSDYDLPSPKRKFVHHSKSV